MEIPAAGGYQMVKTLTSGFNSPIYLAMDGNAKRSRRSGANGRRELAEVQEVTSPRAVIALCRTPTCSRVVGR